MFTVHYVVVIKYFLLSYYLLPLVPHANEARTSYLVYCEHDYALLFSFRFVHIMHILALISYMVLTVHIANNIGNKCARLSISS